jgi:hypothetical protein
MQLVNYDKKPGGKEVELYSCMTRLVCSTTAAIIHLAITMSGNVVAKTSSGRQSTLLGFRAKDEHTPELLDENFGLLVQWLLK